MKKEVNYLKAVFWDYPEFANEEGFKKLLIEKASKDNFIKDWIITRFLEHSRVIDTFKVFKIDEIESRFNELKLRDFTKKKWQRLIEVYGNN